MAAVTSLAVDERTLEDERWVAGLVAEHSPALLQYGMRLTRDPHAAEDAVQEAFLRAWCNRQVLDSLRGTVRGWLFRVVRNIVIDRSRARASRPQEVRDFPYVPPASGDHADRLATAIDVLAVLKKLKPEHRDLLVELYYRDRTPAHVADALGIPLGTVKSRAHHARREVRELMLR